MHLMSAGAGGRPLASDVHGGHMTGDELRLWMTQHGYTALRLSAELGVAERSVFRWRSGAPKVGARPRRNTPDAQDAPRLAGLTGSDTE